MAAMEKGGTSNTNNNNTTNNNNNNGGRTLHNFSLPPLLSWGTQKLLRCSNSTSSLNSTLPPPSQSPPPSKRSRNASFCHRNDGNEIEFEVHRTRGSAFLENGNSPPPQWNLRTRRAAESPVRKEADEVVVERAKFSVPLSRQEVEDDFVAILGRRPPRKPKKRPRYIQKELETIFPGVWLSEITADMYKVNEPPEAPQ